MGQTGAKFQEHTNAIFRRAQMTGKRGHKL